MVVPDYQSLMLPLLLALQDGSAREIGSVIMEMAQRLHLTETDQQERLQSGQLAFPHRVGWARTYMGKAGLLESPRRGFWQITSAGLALLAERPNRIDNTLLSRYAAFVQFRSISQVRQGTTKSPEAPAEEVDQSAGSIECPIDPHVPEPTRAKHEVPNEGPLSFADAAEYILRTFANGSPMHYRAIAAKALGTGLIRTRGQTPEASLNAQIGTEIARDEQRGKMPRFLRHPHGYIGLTEWQPSGLALQIDRHNADIRRQLREKLLTLSPSEFEELIGQLLTKLGFADVFVTGRSGDGGIDARGTLVVGDVIRTRMAVQAKR